MKKIININIEVDIAHLEQNEWANTQDYVENEIDNALGIISDFTDRKYKNCSGKTESGATSYKVSVNHQE